MCFENVIIALPKIVMMIMLEKVLKISRNIDDLVVNVERFMQTRIYYYNCYISKYIWISYGIGGFLYVFNFFWSNSEAEELISLCDRILYLMVFRIGLFIVKLCFDSKGLSKDQI